MGQLAAGIAHEVNNPLGILLLHANLLLEECETGSDVAADLEIIVDQANRCKKIISGLLNFARQNRVVRQPTDLSELVAKVIRTIPIAENVEIDVEDRLADPVAEIDADQIVQVLTNLFTNAQHAMPSGGRILIALDDDADEVILTVSDTGTGIPAEHMAKLFEPVLHHQAGGQGNRPRARGHARHRQDAPRPDQRRVQRRPRGGPHRHHLHHRAAAARGRPRTGGLAAGVHGMNALADLPAREALMDPQQVTLNVVMVDDEEALCQGVRRIIEKYRVHVPDVVVDVAFTFRYFTRGEEFLEHLSEDGAVDLLLVDLKLPGIGGMDVLGALSDQGREVLTIMITAYATFETAVKATKLGAYDFLAKPFTPDELRYAVRKATNQLILSKQARRLAEEKRQVRFNFISVLSHELKAPLNAVEGYLNILRSAETDQNLQMVERSILRVDGMKKLIIDLLDLTRIESGQRERTITRLDLRALAAASIELFAVDADRRGIAVNLEPGPDVELLADGGEAEIVLNNLISNAVKYNRDGGSVRVEVARRGEFARISVTDTGFGLSPDEAAKLFREFTRIKNEHTVKVLGSGLGLSTVRKIANMYEGEATVESEQGVGSTFTVTLRDAQRTRPAAERALTADA